MNEQEIKSWIFLATSMASQIEPADYNGISMIADGINHAVPTHKEMQTAIASLIHEQLIEKSGRKYLLSSKGMSLIKQTSESKQGVQEIWKELQKLV